MNVKDIAKLLHDNYEIEAKKVGWNTQKSCKVEFNDLPEANKKVMLAQGELILNLFNEHTNSKLNKIIRKLEKKINEPGNNTFDIVVTYRNAILIIEKELTKT